MAAPTRSASLPTSSPESASAWRAAATISCAKRPSRRGEDVRELGLDVAGRDDVCADVPAAELPCQGLREPDDPGLRGRIVRLAPVAMDADDRGHVHDRAAALLHHRPADGTARVEDR